MPLKRQLFIFTTMTSLLLAGACGQSETETPEPSPSAALAGDESATAAVAVAAALPRSAAPDGASVFFITPVNGDTVSNPVTIEFGIAGMSVVAAGDAQPQSGHHHLLLDTGLPDLALPIPADANRIHFGDASTSTQLTLDSGEHTLRLLLGDHLHIPHDPPVMSELITITVK